MKIPFRLPFLLCASFAVAAMAAPPPAPSGAPGADSFDSATSPSTTHLGIKFGLTDKADETSAAASWLPAIKLGSSVPPESVVFGRLLPPVVVTANRVKISEREVLTDQGRLAVAERRYISPLYGATFGPLSQIASYYFNPLAILSGWHPNEAEAMTLYREDERVRILSDMDSLIRLEKVGDFKDKKELKRLQFETRRTGIDALYW